MIPGNFIGHFDTRVYGGIYEPSPIGWAQANPLSGATRSVANPICTNGGSGTAKEMSQGQCKGRYLTRFAEQRRCNGDDSPFGVKYWGIGNEGYGDWQIGARTVHEWGPYVAESAR